ncbi:MAG: GntR family transcriptional regulator [Actinomycetota bacterium]|nr:GntR family transcriptional regulator [Actinomycetota bacterium]
MTIDALLSPVNRGRGTGRTSDQVFDTLTEAIRDLRLPPGQLLSESDLADRLQVSRTPVREAIARLVHIGLVIVIPQVGTSVAKIRMADVHEARFVREALEVAAFEEACAADADNCSTLRLLLGRQEEAHASGDLEKFFVADEEFHREIFKLSGHDGSWPVVERMKLQLNRVRRLSLPEEDTIRALIEEHRLIATALEDRDVARGRAHVSAHARRVMEDAPHLQRIHPAYFAP